MIAIAYNDTEGGIQEWRVEPASSVEVKLGLTYRATEQNRFGHASIQSPGAYSVDGLTVMYCDNYYPGGKIMSRSSFVNAKGMLPWAGPSHNPASWDFGWAGYGPLSKILYSERNQYGQIDPKTNAIKIKAAWEVMLRPERVTKTEGFFAVFAEETGRIYFIPLYDDNTIRRTNLLGNDETIIHTFDGGFVRALAITQNRSVRTYELLSPGAEIIASVYYPAEHKSRIYTGIDHGAAHIGFTERFSVAQDYVMVAGTGAFGNGNRILFTQGNQVLVWDNRDHAVYPILYWWTQDHIHHEARSIPSYQFRQFCGGLAVSPDVPKPKSTRKKRIAKAAA